MLNPVAEFDRTLSLWIHAHAHPWLDRLMLAITYGGDWLTLLLVTLAGAAFLHVRQQRKRAAVFLLLAFSLSRILDPLLKLVFQRGRPQLWEVVSRPTSYSFPSGHAFSSMVVYGLAAYLFAQLHPQWRRGYWLGAAVWIFLIGFSRVYLGVHWPSDVVAGFAAGSIMVYGFVYWHKQSAVPNDRYSPPR
jgi:membrane-associated phospholipid phosphatase